MSQQSSLVVVRLMPPGRGAIASVLVEGPGAREAVQSHLRSAGRRSLDSVGLDRLAFGHFGPEPGEEVVVRLRSKESVELHCHGGQAAVAMIEQTLIEHGCRPVGWQEWTKRSSPDPIRAAALLALAEARTERMAAILLDQYQGALTRAIDDVRDRVDRGDLDGAGSLLEDLISRADLGLHLVHPWRVVLAGPPNAGKSTLVNAIVGYARAIVDPQPGTTRDVVTILTAIEGWPVELCDTAGLRDADHPVERAGVAKAREGLAAADLVLAVFDLSRPWSAADAEILAAHPQAIVVHNKADLVPADPTRPAGNRVSALHKQGIEDLLHAVAVELVPDVPAPGDAVPFSADHMNALVQASQDVSTGNAAGARCALNALVGATR